jgi:hypothetical protein
MIPITYQWNGEAMVPMRRFQKACDQQFVIGEFYRLEPIEERSAQSHRHYFACINDAWLNLRDEMAGRFITPEHLRKYALVKAGYCDERTIVCSSKAEAHRLAAFIKPMDEFAVVLVFDATVRVYTAKSQSLRAMGKKDFQESKDKVLEIVSEMIGVKPDELGRAA